MSENDGNSEIALLSNVLDRMTSKGCDHRRLPEDSLLNGYRVGRCLGSGFYGEAYIVTKDMKESVLKVGHVTREECVFGNDMSALDGSHFVKCLDFGTYSDGGVDKNYLVQEKASGQELFSLVKSHVDEPPPELSTLRSVLQVQKKLLHLMNLMMDHQHYYFDLHPGNLFMAANGDITIIDYGATCIPSPERTCDVQHAEAQMNLFVFMDLVYMLIQPSQGSPFPPQTGAIIGVYMRGGSNEGLSAEDATEEVKQRIRSNYQRQGVDEQLSELLLSGFKAFLEPKIFQPQWTFLDQILAVL